MAKNLFQYSVDLMFFRVRCNTLCFILGCCSLNSASSFECTKANPEPCCGKAILSLVDCEVVIIYNTSIVLGLMADMALSALNQIIGDKFNRNKNVENLFTNKKNYYFWRNFRAISSNSGGEWVNDAFHHFCTKMAISSWCTCSLISEISPRSVTRVNRSARRR